MGEISAANREQTTGIEEINSAITQMDDVTRQNASLVEESAAAATSLQSQADTLAQLVATFKLGDQDTGAGQASAGQAGTARPAPVLSAPEKVISPAPTRAHTRPEPAKPAAPGNRPALRAPGRPAPSTTDTEDWTEF
ncbi:MAG: methyl-accepting chemotaxis protein, partial [Castellaniella sp.]